MFPNKTLIAPNQTVRDGRRLGVFEFLLDEVKIGIDHPGNECIPISEIVPAAASTASNSLKSGAGSDD